MEQRPAPLAAWHRVVATGDPGPLADLLHEDCVFRSPAVHAPQEGRALTTTYLAAAFVVLGPTLRYRAEWVAEGSAVLEFEAEVAGRQVHGIDMLRWDAAGRLTEVTVMVRPLQGLHVLVEAMGRELAAQDG